MSSDNYYTVKYNQDDGLWYAVSGSMSVLEDGIPALADSDDPRFEDFDDASEAVFQWGYSEYGIIQEPPEISGIVTEEQFRTWAKNRIEVLQWYLRGDDE